jgi:hypothetical protein
MPNWVPPLEHSETTEGCKCLHYNFSTFKDFTDLGSLASCGWCAGRREEYRSRTPDPLNNPSRALVPPTSKQPQTARNKTEQAKYDQSEDRSSSAKNPNRAAARRLYCLIFRITLSSVWHPLGTPQSLPLAADATVALLADREGTIPRLRM